jgi:hypothetical protein
MIDDERMDERLTAYLDGESSPDEMAEVEVLLREDASMRLRLEKLSETARWSRDLPRRDAPASLADDVMAVLERDHLLDDRGPEPGLRFFRRGGFRTTLAMAAMIMIAITIGLWGLSQTAERGSEDVEYAMADKVTERIETNEAPADEFQDNRPAAGSGTFQPPASAALSIGRVDTDAQRRGVTIELTCADADALDRSLSLLGDVLEQNATVGGEAGDGSRQTRTIAMPVSKLRSLVSALGDRGEGVGMTMRLSDESDRRIEPFAKKSAVQRKKEATPASVDDLLARLGVPRPNDAERKAGARTRSLEPTVMVTIRIIGPDEGSESSSGVPAKDPE